MAFRAEDADGFDSVVWESSGGGPGGGEGGRRGGEDHEDNHDEHSREASTAGRNASRSTLSSETLGAEEGKVQGTTLITGKTIASPPTRPSRLGLERRESAGSKARRGEYIVVSVTEPIKELEGTKDAHVTYLVKTKTNIPLYPKEQFQLRRRFQDFVFLREHLTHDFPACVVAPLPSKHRLDYLTGDRFSAEFLEKRRTSLHRFLERVVRHPTLHRSAILIAFLSSSSWSHEMLDRTRRPVLSPDRDRTEAEGSGSGAFQSPGVLDSIGDRLINAFAKVKKPDEKFLQMSNDVGKYEENLKMVEKVWGRAVKRLIDLQEDYDDLATSFLGLAQLETGIQAQIGEFSGSLEEFSNSVRRLSEEGREDGCLGSIKENLGYCQTMKNVLKMRDQKQIDFEDLNDYLATTRNERDRLAAGSDIHVAKAASGRSIVPIPGVGYFAGMMRDRMEDLRGVDTERARRERMRKLDGRIDELGEAVTNALDTSQRFSNEVEREYAVFVAAKRAEMKAALQELCDDHIRLFETTIESFSNCEPALDSIVVEV